MNSRSPAFTPDTATVSEPFKEAAADGFMLGGFTWRHALPDAQRPVVIINAATSVRCRHYSRFADYLFANGFDVITYDYRGIGESRPASLKGLEASWTDWGALDFEAMLKRAQRSFPASQSMWSATVSAARRDWASRAGHSSAGDRRRAVRLLARLCAGSSLADVGQWHVVMPLLTRICGYFPASASAGWKTRPPAWSATGARLPRATSSVRAAADSEDKRPPALRQRPRKDLGDQHQRRPYGTIPAIERLLGYFTHASKTHLRIAPQDIGEKQVGHFAFFRSAYQATLWPIA
jgi:predicted alpha/beta hydrolase